MEDHHGRRRRRREHRPRPYPRLRVYGEYFEPNSNVPIPEETLRRHENRVNA